MPEDVFLILHGWGGNKPDHWQEHLYHKLQAAGQRVHYPQMPSPQQPELAAWLSRLTAELDEIGNQSPGAPLTVLAHSLGSITWMHYAAANAGSGRSGTHPVKAQAVRADRVLLVAPPYIVPQIPPIDVPPTVTAFFPPPTSAQGIAQLARETVLVASDTDDYATFDQSAGYAQLLGIPIHKLAGAGHISPYYGYGEWPWVLEWCLRRAELPPTPNR